jgi:hypothetical protein
MSGLGTARIPFNVRMSDGTFRGEAIGIGETLKDDCIFEVRMTNGQSFLLKAETDREIQRYSWTSSSTDFGPRVLSIIGKVIERFYKRK